MPTEAGSCPTGMGCPLGSWVALGPLSEAATIPAPGGWYSPILGATDIGGGGAGGGANRRGSREKAGLAREVLVILVCPDLQVEVQVHILVRHAGGLFRGRLLRPWTVCREKGCEHLRKAFGCAPPKERQERALT